MAWSLTQRWQYCGTHWLKQPRLRPPRSQLDCYRQRHSHMNCWSKMEDMVASGHGSNGHFQFQYICKTTTQLNLSQSVTRFTNVHNKSEGPVYPTCQVVESFLLQYPWALPNANQIFGPRVAKRNLSANTHQADQGHQHSGQFIHIYYLINP